MHFFSNLVKSCHDLVWLKAAPARQRNAWGYFFLFSLLTTLVTLAALAFIVLPGVRMVKSAAASQIPDFTATLKGGELSVTGVKQPYTYTADSDHGNFVVVVNTVATSSLMLADFIADGQNGILVTRDKMEISQSDHGQYRVQYWAGAKDGVLTKADVENVVQEFTSPKVFIVVGIIASLLLYTAVLIGTLFSLLIITLIVFIIAAIGKRAISYGHLFIIGLYAITLPTIITDVLTLLGVSHDYVYWLALIAFMLAVVFTKETAPAAVPPATPPVTPPPAPPKS